jgi:hypothetical protein
MFRTVSLSIIRSLALYTQKHVEFYSKSEFENIVYLVGFIKRTNDLCWCSADSSFLLNIQGKDCGLEIIIICEY